MLAADDVVRTNNDNLINQINVNSERVDSENRVTGHREASIGYADVNQLHHKQ